MNKYYKYFSSPILVGIIVEASCIGCYKEIYNFWYWFLIGIVSVLLIELTFYFRKTLNNN